MAREVTSIRLDAPTIVRLDAVAAKLTENNPVMPATRAAVMRASMLRGLEAYELDLGVKRKK